MSWNWSRWPWTRPKKRKKKRRPITPPVTTPTDPISIPPPPGKVTYKPPPVIEPVLPEAFTIKADVEIENCVVCKTRGRCRGFVTSRNRHYRFGKTGHMQLECQTGHVWEAKFKLKG